RAYLDVYKRQEYFSGELEAFLLMARDEQDDPLNLKGSFAGAMGYGQFMPSSYKQYAVDFSGDGHINPVSYTHLLPHA
ncbi:lytic murein transglycosylase, partial [Enterococcus faecalis]|nr:lytic murein transglycosylase [Enterococcus faecalis]